MKGSLQINSKEKKELFILQIGTIFLKITPVLFLIYLYIISRVTGGKVFSPVIEDMNVTIAFITAMLGPFAGICCQSAYDNLKQNNNVIFSEITLVIIAVSQLLLLNFIISCLISYVLYKLYDGLKIDFDKLKFQLKEKKVMQNLLISLFTMFVAILCTYVRVKTI